MRAGRAGSAEVAVEVEGGRAGMMVIDVAAKSPGPGGDPLSALVLRSTDDPQSPAARRSPLRFENETTGTRWFLAIVAACLLLGPTLRQFNNVVGLTVSALAVVALVAFWVRKLLYRAPSPDR